MSAAFLTSVEAHVADLDLGRASARKRGRSPRWPYVPVVQYGDGRTKNPARGRAFATCEEAVAFAQRCIDAQRELLAQQLLDRRYRALREQHGFPRELEEVPA